MTRQIRLMVTMGLFLLAVSGTALGHAYAADGAATQSAAQDTRAELRIEQHAGAAVPSFAAGMSEQAVGFSTSGPALALLGGFLGWMSRRRVARRGAWCRSHG